MDECGFIVDLVRWDLKPICNSGGFSVWMFHSCLNKGDGPSMVNMRMPSSIIWKWGIPPTRHFHGKMMDFRGKIMDFHGKWWNMIIIHLGFRAPYFHTNPESIMCLFLLFTVPTWQFIRLRLFSLKRFSLPHSCSLGLCENWGSRISMVYHYCSYSAPFSDKPRFMVQFIVFLKSISKWYSRNQYYL